MTSAQRGKRRDRAPGAGSSRATRNIASGFALGFLTLLTQIVLRRELAPGEFGTLNALFGVTLVLIAPLAALGIVLRQRVEPAEVGPLLNRMAPAWGVICLVLLFIVLPPLQLPRVSLQFYMLLAVGAGLLAICGRPAMAPRWCAMLGVSAAVMRLLVSAWGGRDWPVAETGLGALVLGGTLAGLPALRDQSEPRKLLAIWRELRPSLIPALATVSLGGAIALFTNADRIAAQPAFTARDAQFIDYARFDQYQAAGLLARGLLWGLLPLLVLFYRQREGLAKTTYVSLRWFWIYLGTLLAASIVLACCGGLERLLFGGLPDVFLPGFAGAVFMLGLVQGIGVFALASRRHVECFLLAVCSVGYTAFLFIANNPQLLTTCMAGGALGSLALVLLVGVVRYARSHP
jgi:hypothetical protein